jgi:hypothetical protein
MPFDFFSREFFDALVLIVFGLGVIAAAVRLYQDFTRPLPDDDGAFDDDDTRPHPPKT